MNQGSNNMNKNQRSNRENECDLTWQEHCSDDAIWNLFAGVIDTVYNLDFNECLAAQVCLSDM